MIKSEKGSITLFTLIAMMFFLTIAFTAYTSAMIKLQAQNEDLERIKASYEQDLTPEGLASLYEEITTNKPYTVTFDANGGTVDLPSKEVKYGKEYGKLPTPTREGYKFVGWNGKNKLNLDGRTEQNPGGEFDNTSIRSFSSNGIYKGITCNNYYERNRVNSYQIDSNDNNVTINSKQSGYGVGFDNKVLPNTVYTISTGKNSELSLRIGEYSENGNLVRYNIVGENGKIEERKYTFTTTATTYWLLIVVASDFCSLNTNHTNYNIQLLEGDVATEYEPYYITSDTKVTQKKDHTLTAIWDEGVPPKIELSKETYIEEDFSNWTLNNARVVQEDGKNVLIMGEDGNSFSAQKRFIVNKEKHYFMYDAYTTSESPNFTPQGGTHVITTYYDSNDNITHDTSAGGIHTRTVRAKPLTLNTWENLTHEYGLSIYGFDKVNFNFVSSITAYSVPPVKIRNFKAYGEAIPSSFYDIKITSSDNVGVTTTKYAKGEQTKEYFETNGINVENNQIRVTENGIYTVCVGDKAGNMTTKTIEITNIQ